MTHSGIVAQWASCSYKSAALFVAKMELACANSICASRDNPVFCVNDDKCQFFGDCCDVSQIPAAPYFLGTSCVCPTYAVSPTFLLLLFCVCAGVLSYVIACVSPKPPKPPSYEPCQVQIGTPFTKNDDNGVPKACATPR